MLASDWYVFISLGIIFSSLMLLLGLGIVSLFTPKETGGQGKVDYKFNFIENQHYWEADK